MEALQVLSLLVSSYIYVICQALDLRALQNELVGGLKDIVFEELSLSFGSYLTHEDIEPLSTRLSDIVIDTLNQTTTMDADARMKKVAAATSTPLIYHLTSVPYADAAYAGAVVLAIPQFQSHVASRATELLEKLQSDYLTGARGPAPASRFLSKTRPVYEFVRKTIGIKMHGAENFSKFANGLGVDDVTIGQNISLIHEVRCLIASNVCHC